MSVGAAAVIGCRVVYFYRVLGVVLFERHSVASWRSTVRSGTTTCTCAGSTRWRWCRRTSRTDGPCAGPRRRRPPLPAGVDVQRRVGAGELGPEQSDITPWRALLGCPPVEPVEAPARDVGGDRFGDEVVEGGRVVDQYPSGVKSTCVGGARASLETTRRAEV